ncbi:MAG: 2-oxo acid dehydrogenase subunit E2, partial [Bacteroidota bacterium]
MKLLQEISVPQESVNDDMLLVVSVPFADGAKVSERDIVLELESSKTTFTIETETDGFIQYLCQEGDEVAVNAVVIKIYDQAPSSPATVEPVPAISSNGNGHHPVQEAPKIEKISVEQTFFSAAAEQLITEYKLDPAQFSGQDFVSQADVQAALGIKPASNKIAIAPPRQQSPPAAKEVALPKAQKAGISLDPLSSIKKREIKYLSSVQSAGLNSEVEVLVDARGILAFVKPHFKVIKDSFLPLIIYEASRLLRQYRAFNAYFSSEGIAYYEAVNIGIAMDMEKGLKVLKVADADQLGLPEVEQQILQLSEAYLEDRISPDQLDNITFTITDLSSEGVSRFRPLINMKNSAILGVSALDERLERFSLSLAFDHRISVGKEAAAFLTALKSRLESYREVQLSAGLTYYDPEKVHCHKCMKKLSQEIGPIGFLKTVGKDGREVFTCQSCLLGHTSWNNRLNISSRIFCKRPRKTSDRRPRLVGLPLRARSSSIGCTLVWRRPVLRSRSITISAPSVNYWT